MLCVDSGSVFLSSPFSPSVNSCSLLSRWDCQVGFEYCQATQTGGLLPTRFAHPSVGNHWNQAWEHKSLSFGFSCFSSV